MTLLSLCPLRPSFLHEAGKVKPKWLLIFSKPRSTVPRAPHIRVLHDVHHGPRGGHGRAWEELSLHSCPNPIAGSFFPLVVWLHLKSLELLGQTTPRPACKCKSRSLSQQHMLPGLPQTPSATAQSWAAPQRPSPRNIPGSAARPTDWGGSKTPEAGS